MKVDGRAYRTIWLNEDGSSVDVIDQRWLPHAFKVATLRSAAEAATAIRDMWVRGAPLIGATAAYGLALAMREDPSDGGLETARDKLAAARPTAINLRWALDAVRKRLAPLAPRERREGGAGISGRVREQHAAGLDRHGHRRSRLRDFCRHVWHGGNARGLRRRCVPGALCGG